MGEPALEKSVEATREPSFLLAKPEKRLLRWIAARLPRWILPNDLTVLGVIAALGVCVAYQLSNESIDFLWVASGLLVLQWLGDSLDGTLARVRRIERPTYGYYLDHLVDAIATAARARPQGARGAPAPTRFLATSGIVTGGPLAFSKRGD